MNYHNFSFEKSRCKEKRKKRRSRKSQNQSNESFQHKNLVFSVDFQWNVAKNLVFSVDFQWNVAKNLVSHLNNRKKFVCNLHSIGSFIVDQCDLDETVCFNLWVVILLQDNLKWTNFIKLNLSIWTQNINS